MPLPLFLGFGIGAAIAGVGAASGIRGAVKTKEANDTMQSANSRHKRNIARFEKQSEVTTADMDSLEKKGLEIVNSFERFSQVFEKIQNKPQFKSYTKNDVDIPKYKQTEIKSTLAGETVASTIAAGVGGGIVASSAGSAMAITLGIGTLGLGLLVGGIISNFTGSSLSNKADKAWSQMKKAEEEIDKICEYLIELSNAANSYSTSLSTVNEIYVGHLNRLTNIVEVQNKTMWHSFTEDEKLITENTVMLVSLLSHMCKVQFVLAAENENEMNKVNYEAINEVIEDASSIIRDRKLAGAV